MNCAAVARSVRVVLSLAFLLEGPTVFCACAKQEMAKAPSILDSAKPQINKVEPPNWWAGHALRSVQVLIRGKHLETLRPPPRTADAEGVSIASVRVNDEGTYAFLEVSVAEDARPGPRRLPLVGRDGPLEIPFELLSPLAPAGRFQGFSSDDVLYLIMPDRFANGEPGNDDPPPSRGLLDRSKSRYYHGGDFQGVIDHLPYLERLGVTAIWLTPVYDNVNHLNDRETYDNEAITDYHGYGSVDFYGVEEHFGDMSKLRELVDAAHAKNIKVILDQVANHTGPYHPWANAPPSPRWLHGSEARHRKCELDFRAITDPNATNEARKASLDGWFLDLLPDLNQDDPDVARYLIQNTLWWIGMTGIDGLRQDTLPYVPRTFWRDWMAGIKRQYPTLRVVGEANHRDAPVVAFFQKGVTRFDGVDSGIDALFDFPLVYPLRRVFAEGKSMRELATAFENDALYPDPNMLVTFAGLHDMKRFMNEPGATLEGLALAHALVMTSRGVPMIYYGDEIGMPGGDDPDNRRDFPGEWSDDDRRAFRDDAAGAPATSPPAMALLDQVSRLARLRHELPALRRGSMRTLAVTDRSLSFARIVGAPGADHGDTAIVVFNNAPTRTVISTPVRAVGLADGAVLEDRLGRATVATVKSGSIDVELGAHSVAVFVPKRH